MERTLPLGRGTSHNQRGTLSAKGRWLAETSGEMGVWLSSNCSCFAVLALEGLQEGKQTSTPTSHPRQPAEKLPHALVSRPRERLLQFLSPGPQRSHAVVLGWLDRKFSWCPCALCAQDY